MGEDRTSYQNDRVLIEASRILTPQFAGTTIAIDGAQVELLRNIVSYLHQERTFVSEYHGTYYLTASDADFDDLSAIVADLEEKLMGDLNVPLGIKEQWFQGLGGNKAGDGTYVASSASVPAGYVYRLEAISLLNTTGARGVTMIRIYASGEWLYLAHSPGLAAWEPLVWDGIVTLKTGDYVTVSMTACINADLLYGGVIGYKMLI